MADARRFTIGDGMVLVAATAAGMAWSSRAWGVFHAPEAQLTDSAWAWEWTLVGLAMSAPCLVAWTLALCVLRLRTPRPPWRRASRRPGMTACLSAAIALPLALAPMAVKVVRELNRFSTWGDYSRMFPAATLETMLFAFPLVGFVVLIGWMTLGVQRQWRCERSWIDRTGRVLGVLWIASGAILGVQFVDLVFR